MQISCIDDGNVKVDISCLGRIYFTDILEGEYSQDIFDYRRYIVCYIVFRIRPKWWAIKPRRGICFPIKNQRLRPIDRLIRASVRLQTGEVLDVVEDLGHARCQRPRRDAKIDAARRTETGGVSDVAFYMRIF